MKFYVKEHNWMWSNLKLSLAECRVYAYIYGLSHRGKGGYEGSKRHLAELLGLNAGAVKRVLDSLKERQLIVNTDNCWKSVATNNTGVATNNENVATNNENVASNNSPHTPLLYNNIKNKQSSTAQNARIEEKKKEENLGFMDFWFLFSPPEEMLNRENACRRLWESATFSRAKKQAIMNELTEHQMNGTLTEERNPFFYLNNHNEPQPTFLRGDEGGDIVQVLYNGKFKLCSRATMELFGLQWVRDW